MQPHPKADVSSNRTLGRKIGLGKIVHVSGRGWNSFQKVLGIFLQYIRRYNLSQADFSHSVQLKNNRPGDEAILYTCT